MIPEYRLTLKAQHGYLHIIQQVELRFGPRVASAVEERLAQAFEQLASMPLIGHLREDITFDQSVRFWSVGRTLIAYQPHSWGVEILFVESGEMDWSGALDEEDP